MIYRGASFTCTFLSLTTAGAANTVTVPTVQVIKDLAAAAAATNAPTHVAGGVWRITLTAAEMTADVTTIVHSGSGLVGGSLAISTEADYTAARAGYLDKLNVAGTLAHTGIAAQFMATGFAVPGDAMSLTVTERNTLAGVIDSRLLDAGDATDLIASIVARIGNTNLDQAALVAAIKAALFDVGSIANKLAVDGTGRVTAANMVVAPDNNSITAIKLKTDNLPATPAAVGSAMTLEAGERTTLANLVNTTLTTAHGAGSWQSGSGGSGGGASLSEATVAALEGSIQILLVSPYVPGAAPVLILPEPSPEPSLCTVFGDLQTPAGELAAGVELVFTLLRPETGAKGARLISGKEVTTTTDASGRFTVQLERNDLLQPLNKTKWKVECASLWNRAREITLTTPTFNIGDLIS
ncbi:MAG TPA: hypothetical protein VF614_16670 [Chthoniobacteraceae bacterium]|jgi:hypothetical protein